MDVYRVIYEVAHRFGIRQLALQMGMTEMRLLQKLNPHNEKENLTLAQFMQMVAIVRPPELIAALGEIAGFQVTLGSAEGGPRDVMRAFLSVAKECNDVVSAFSRSAEDGRVSRAEMSEIEREAQEAIASVQRAVRAAGDVFARGGRF